MAGTPIVYVICDQNCKFEGMTKEQILTAIVQAVNEGTIGNIDTGFITTIKTINGLPLKFFVGTQAQYNALSAEAKDGLFAIITDDTTKENLFKVLETLQTELSEIKAGLISGAFVVKKAAEAEAAKSIIPIDFTADEIKPTKTGLYAVTLANPRATVLLSITDLNKNTSASVEVEYGEYPTVPKLKTYIVKYTSGTIYLDVYAFIRSETTTFEKIQQDNSIESCYLIVPYGAEAAEPTKYYSITTNLTNCYSTNTETSIIEGGFYTNGIYANNGYEKPTITVTMGGIDITDSCANSDDSWSFVWINEVTGDIVITVTATAINNDTGGGDNTGGDDPNEGETTAVYQLVEYIETDGNQYIDTGLYPSQFNGATMGVKFTGARNDKNTNNADEYLFGCRDYNGSAVNSIGNAKIIRDPQNVLLEVGQADNAVTYIGEIAKNEKFVIQTKSKVDDITNSYLYVDNVGGARITTNDLNGVQIWHDYTIYLLWCNRASEGAIPFCGKVYGITISYGSEIVLDLVPCYRTSDGVIGMYDTVGGGFYTNSGTGAFTKGANIN